jgi:hypothetical protein
MNCFHGDSANGVNPTTGVNPGVCTCPRCPHCGKLITAPYNPNPYPVSPYYPWYYITWCGTSGQNTTTGWC